MTTKEQYELEPSKWVVYSKWKNSTKFGKNIMPAFDDTHLADYKLILKEHEHIADAVIADSGVEVEFRKIIVKDFGWTKVNNFFKEYNSNLYYRLKPQEPIQINSMEDLNDLQIGEEMQDIETVNRTNISKPKQETLTITDEDGKVYEFEKPEFECELVKVDTLGRVYFMSDERIYAWREDDGTIIISMEDTYNIGDSVYSKELTPIKPKKQTLIEILEDVKYHKVSITDSELLIKDLYCEGE